MKFPAIIVMKTVISENSSNQNLLGIFLKFSRNFYEIFLFTALNAFEISIQPGN